MPGFPLSTPGSSIYSLLRAKLQACLLMSLSRAGGSTLSCCLQVPKADRPRGVCPKLTVSPTLPEASGRQRSPGPHRGRQREQVEGHCETSPPLPEVSCCRCEEGMTRHSQWRSHILAWPLLVFRGWWRSKEKQRVLPDRSVNVSEM